MKISISPSWDALLSEEYEKPYLQELNEFVKAEREHYRIYPPAQEVFNAFKHCPADQLKVVILGQDPYHGHGQANGLAFSVHEGVTLPPSLKNIFKEVAEEFSIAVPQNGNLERWADQGVLLLNATLTVREKSPGSHQKKGWEEFTDQVVEKIATEMEGIVFMLWGSYAQKKGSLIDADKHLVLKSPHPSPFSVHRGFFGNGHFKKANEYLQEKGEKAIDWS